MLKDGTRKNGKRKEFLLSDTGMAIAIALLMTLISIALMENMVFLDDWYYEACADGLFGSDNRSILTIGPNFLFMGMIYLLSLTGIRLSWLHVLLACFNFVSSVIICRYILSHLRGVTRYVTCVFTLLLVAPFIFFYMQFTLTAAYVIAAGCLWLFDCIENDRSKRAFLFGIVWVVIGGIIRFSCIYFTIVFLGAVWLVKTIRFFLARRGTDTWKRLFKNIFFRRLLPFLLPVILVLGLECVQQGMMNAAYPGYSEWNSVRASVEDYALPDYFENLEVYQEVGISYNDYRLLSIMNNRDEAFFDDELYGQISALQSETRQEENAQAGFTGILAENVSQISRCCMFWIFLMAVVFAILFMDAWCAIGFAAIFCGIVGMSTYFTWIGRLIWRTEWPIWIAALVAAVILLCDRGLCFRIKMGTATKSLLGIAVCVAIVLIAPSDNGRSGAWSSYSNQSVWKIYQTRVESSQNFIRYAKNKVFHEPIAQYDTINTEVTDYLVSHKENYYYHLFTYNWFQILPLTDKDVFRTAEVGAGENFGTLGQYFIHMQAFRNTQAEYGIDQPFRDLVNENVRVVVTTDEMHDRTGEVCQYLEEHYYSDVSYSVEDVVSNVSIGRYLQNMDTDSMTETDGLLEADYLGSSEYAGMAKIEISRCVCTDYDYENDMAYIQLVSDDGSGKTYCLMKSDGGLRAYLYDDDLTAGTTYTVNFIVQDGENRCVVRNAGQLAVPGIYETKSMEKLDVASDGFEAGDAVSGFYWQEDDFVWAVEYSSVRLNNSLITKNGLWITLELPEFVKTASTPVSIYVNGKNVYELAPEAGKYDIVIPAEEIQNADNNYYVEIVCPYSVNPALDYGEDDTRDLSVKMYYMGPEV